MTHKMANYNINGHSWLSFHVTPDWRGQMRWTRDRSRSGLFFLVRLFLLGWGRSVELVEAKLMQFHVSSPGNDPEPREAAEMFLNLVLGSTARIVAFNFPLPEEALRKKRVKSAVKLFLNGLLFQSGIYSAP
jgi:hypothetical protein